MVHYDLGLPCSEGGCGQAMRNRLSQRPTRLFAASITSLGLAILSRSPAFVFAKYAAIATSGEGIATIIVNPWYWAQLGALGSQAVFWMLVLRMMPLSTAYPAMSLVYGLSLTWAWLVFDERVALLHIVGVAIIILGVLVSTPPTLSKA